MTTILIIFWVSFGIVFYTYIGYGILLRLVLLIKERVVCRRELELPSDLPRVTLFITAWNEQDVVEAKMENCKSLNYPTQLLDILWVTDGSTDKTNDLLSNYDVKVYFEPARHGKCAAMNRGMGYVSDPITIFTDANTMLNRDAIIEIVRQFSDPRCGCVAGEKRVLSNSKDGAAAGGEGAYWRYESKLKEWDSRLNSCVGAAGELFAVRTNLFKHLPPDTLLDDFVISLKIAMKGYRIAYAPTAYAQESASADMLSEQKRKVRISAGGLQAIWRLKPLLNPFKYGLFSIQYISHRVLRWTITPILFFALLPSNIAITMIGAPDFYTILLILQIAFYLLAVLGWALQNRNIKNKFLFIPYYLIFMNFSVFKGVVYLAKHKGKGTWERANRA